MSTPSVGRIVHFVWHGDEHVSQCRAAIITETDPAPDDVPEPGQVFASVAILNPESMFFNRMVLQDEDDHSVGTWHWPERV